jgi:signal transduction histidine kinase/CheY-like chemotaxis protein
MSSLRFLSVLGCAIAVAAALLAMAEPAYLKVLSLVGASAAGVALLASLFHRDTTTTAEPDAAKPAPLAAAPEAAGASANKELLDELERHKALENQLLLAKQEAEAATMAKGEFLATMSHEIRTPLNGIIPLLDLLLSTDLSADQRDYLTTAFGSAKELLRIVDDILDYSKLDAQKLQLENVGLNLREVTTAVMRLMEKNAEAKGLRLELAIDPSVRLAVRGDPVRLRQVLTNLISNAIKFTERGSVSLQIKRLGETRTRNQLRFEVRDTGIGIAPEAAANLFQAFVQADTSTTRTFGGTGLGLAICKRIVTLMGGKIGVDSAPGKGSNFWFEVALDKALGDIEGRIPSESTEQRVLLVSANAAQQRRFETALKQWGMAYALASNTQEAVSRLRTAQRPGQSLLDVVLVDVGSIPTTALALHRALVRETRPENTVRVYLRGDSSLPAELASTPGFHVLPRDMADSELHARLQALLDTPEDERAGVGAAPEPPSEKAAPTPAPPPEPKVAPKPVTKTATKSAPKAAPKPAPAAASASVTAEPSAGAKASHPLAAVRVRAKVRSPAASTESESAPSALTVPDPASAPEEIEIPAAEAMPAPPAATETPAPDPAKTAARVSGERPVVLGKPASSAITPAAPSAAPASGARVLLVEDNPVNRQVAQRLLSLANIEFDCAENGKEALDKMNAGAYVAVLMDCQMPIMDGYTATRKRRQFESEHALVRTPIIAMTANAMLGDREKCIEAGMDDYMSKPLSRALLESTLRTWLDASPVPSAPSAVAVATPVVAAPQAAATPATSQPLVVTTTEPPLDMEILGELREIMGPEFVSLVQVFLADAPVALERIRSLSAGQDLAAIAAPAHTLKSTSANLGAMILSGQAKALEMDARQNSLRAAPARAAALSAEFERVAAALRRAIA